MAEFWSPYDSFTEARDKLCCLADAVGAEMGVSFSDGRNICILRQARSSGGRSIWLNVLTNHIATPPPPPPAKTIGGKLSAWFWRAMELEGQAEIDNAQMQMAGSQAMVQELRDHVWEPAHEFLIRHKLGADRAGLVIDAVGIGAAIVFCFAAPELLAAAAAGSLIAGVGLATGAMASTGSVILFFIDGVAYVAEARGDEALAKSMEDSPTLGWIRIGATLMLLPDLPVGASRALTEITKTGVEAGEAATRAAKAQSAAASASGDVKNIRNPVFHPIKVLQGVVKVRKFKAEAELQARLVDAANQKIRMLYARDVAVFPGATAAGATVMVGVPPKVALSKAQNAQDEAYMKSLAPTKSWPKDIRMDMRVIGFGSGQATQ